MIDETLQNPDGTFKVGNRAPNKFVEGDERCYRDGRPKGQKGLSTVLKRLMQSEYLCEDPFLGNRVKRSYEEILNLALMAKAAKGNIPAIDLIYNRLVGKPTQPIDLDSTGELNIKWGKEESLILKDEDPVV